MRFSSSSTLLVLASFVTLVLPYYGASAAAIGDGGVELLTNGQRLARGMKPAQPRKLFEADKVIAAPLAKRSPSATCPHHYCCHGLETAVEVLNRLSVEGKDVEFSALDAALNLGAAGQVGSHCAAVGSAGKCFGIQVDLCCSESVKTGTKGIFLGVGCKAAVTI